VEISRRLWELLNREIDDKGEFRDTRQSMAEDDIITGRAVLQAVSAKCVRLHAVKDRRCEFFSQKRDFQERSAQEYARIDIVASRHRAQRKE
jgi:hypothetical protein